MTLACGILFSVGLFFFAAVLTTLEIDNARRIMEGQDDV